MKLYERDAASTGWVASKSASLFNLAFVAASTYLTARVQLVPDRNTRPGAPANTQVVGTLSFTNDLAPIIDHNLHGGI